jgi:hypothetical protein
MIETCHSPGLSASTCSMITRTSACILTQFVKVQVLGLPTGEDRLNDIGGKKGAAEDLTDVTVCQSGIAGQRSHIECFFLNHLLIPAVSSR